MPAPCPPTPGRCWRSPALMSRDNDCVYPDAPAHGGLEPAVPVGEDASAGQSQPWLGHRTVIVEGGQIAGVVPVPTLINRPGPTTRVLERLLWNTGLLIARVRYAGMSRSPHRDQPPPPSGSP